MTVLLQEWAVLKKIVDSAVVNYNIYTSHMSEEQNDFFTHNDIWQLSLKWFWLSIIIIEHQKQSKTPKQ